MPHSQSKNINDSYFDGYYKEIWRSTIPEALTKAEVDFLIEKTNLKAGSKVLDLMCGYGRHAIALAKKGIEVTAVDNLADYIKEIDDATRKENLPIKSFLADVMQFQPQEEYDLIICLGNNLSFFNMDDSGKLFSMIAFCLTKGGKFIFSTWMITEIVIKQFREKGWSYVGELKFLSDSKYLFSPSRIETESIFIANGGKTEFKKSIDYIYSLNETESMLKESGFIMKEIWSIPGKKKFTIGEPRAYIVAEKI